MHSNQEGQGPLWIGGQGGHSEKQTWSCGLRKTRRSQTLKDGGRAKAPRQARAPHIVLQAECSLEPRFREAAPSQALGRCPE